MYTKFRYSHEIHGWEKNVLIFHRTCNAYTIHYFSLPLNGQRDNTKSTKFFFRSFQPNSIEYELLRFLDYWVFTGFLSSFLFSERGEKKNRAIKMFIFMSLFGFHFFFFVYQHENWIRERKFFFFFSTAHNIAIWCDLFSIFSRCMSVY